MNSEKETIKVYFEKGFKSQDIVEMQKALNLRQAKVYRICARLRQGQSTDNRHRSGRRPWVRTKAVIKSVRVRIRSNSQT